eukprot:4955442-Ditylum_brightwellii.AAC.1
MLEPWDNFLHKDLVLEISVYEIAQICQIDAHINISSNSSFIKEENVMTFGWIIINNDKEILAEHAGPAFGQVTSFRVEGYGILSASQFLYHISKYTNQTIKCDMNIYIDDEGIVKRLKDQLAYTHDYLFNTLEPVWDVVAQVADTLKQYNSLITITHVKSHQDDNTLFDKLTMPARLNIAADNLATNYIIQHGTPCMKVPRMKIKCVQLCTMTGAITSHYSKKIRDI